MRKVVCAHLYNDFSGSPLILSTVIKGFIEKGVEVDLITSQNTPGFLSNLKVGYVDSKYQFAENKLIRLFRFFFTQLVCFFKMFRYRNEDVIVYVNTLLPFGVAVAGKLMRKKVIFHIHETSVKPPILKNFLKWICGKTASEIIYVSKFLQTKEPIAKVPSSVVYNALSTDFIKRSEKTMEVTKTKNETFTVLMLCSLKAYKGVPQFLALSNHLPHINFHLVLNAEKIDINLYFRGTVIPQNLKIFPKQNNVHPFYAGANLVVNLSHPEQWIETFGMTLLEGMQYGLPAIAPPVGGCTEFVETNVNGYQIDQRNLPLVAEKINELNANKELYKNLSLNATKKANTFNVKEMCNRITMVTFMDIPTIVD